MPNINLKSKNDLIQDQILKVALDTFYTHFIIVVKRDSSEQET